MIIADSEGKIYIMFTALGVAFADLYDVYGASCTTTVQLLPHVKGRSETVHVDVSILLQFLGKLRGQRRVEGGRKVPQSVLQSQLRATQTRHKRSSIQLDIVE